MGKCSIAAALLLCATLNGQDTPSKLERGRAFLGLAPPADPAAAARGKAMFTQNCGFCHGSDARGAEGPNLLRSGTVLHDQKGETIGPVLRRGFPDKGMPAFSQLTDAQAYDVASFLHERVEAATNRYGYQLLNLVTGDAKAGQAYFNGAGTCHTCHSPSGDLAHIGTRFDPADLQARFLYPGESHEKTTATVTLASGESISGVLRRIDDFEISLTDASGTYRSWPRDSVKVTVKDPLSAHLALLAKYTDADMHNMLAYLVTLK